MCTTSTSEVPDEQPMDGKTLGRDVSSVGMIIGDFDCSFFSLVNKLKSLPAAPSAILLRMLVDVLCKHKRN